MKKQRGGFFLGLIVGLLIGLGLALGVALYISKVPVPFVNKVPQRTSEQDAAEAERNKNWDPNSSLYGKTPIKPSGAASGVVPPLPGAASAPRAASAPATAPTAASAPTSSRDPAAILAGKPVPASAPAVSTAAGADPFTYFVQAGAYSRAEEAEQQRAKLAMLGLSAKITEREQSGRTWYRVRVGPLDSKDAAAQAQQKLQAASIEADLVRVQKQP
jgi:cell division protein FtsN